MVKLTYIDNVHTAMTNNLQSNTNVRYRPTAAYDVDPLLASTATPGFNEYAAFYKFYRVHAFAYRVTFVNLETACPVLAYCFPSQLDPGANISYSTASEWQGNPYFKARQMSPKGGMDRTTISGYVGIKKFVGSKTANYDDNYSAQTNAVPNNNVYLSIGGLSSATAFTTLGVAFQFRVTMYVEFYERVTLTA
jgi:hypothetical protein